jgi:hypothetical protein
MTVLSERVVANVLPIALQRIPLSTSAVSTTTNVAGRCANLQAPERGAGRQKQATV